MEPRLSRESFTRVGRRLAYAAGTFALAIVLVAVSQAVSPRAGHSASALSPAPYSNAAGARPAEDRSAGTAIVDDLEDCSPFYSFDGAQHLDFDDGGVSRTEESSAGAPGEAASATNAEGAYTADDASSRVRVTLGGARREYTLIVPTDSDECLLVVGDPHRADLRQSWYGEIVDEPEIRPAMAFHAALRRGRTARYARGHGAFPDGFHGAM
jgi:hypothetical protein